MCVHGGEAQLEPTATGLEDALCAHVDLVALADGIAVLTSATRRSSLRGIAARLLQPEGRGLR